MEIKAKYADTFFAETGKLLNEFSEILLAGESVKKLTSKEVNEMFRITHTLKGSFAMMDLPGLLALAHSLEDIFVTLKREAADETNLAELFDIFFEALDAMREGVASVKNGGGESRSLGDLIAKIKANFADGSKKRALKITLKSECAMENVRAFLIVSTLRGLCPALEYSPSALDSDINAARKIRENGLLISFPESSYETIRDELYKDTFIETVEPADGFAREQPEPEIIEAPQARENPSRQADEYALVSVEKLERLRVAANELLEMQSRVLNGLGLNAVSGDAAKIKRSGEYLRGAVEALRMSPVSSVFQKLHRTVREAGKKLDKDIRFVSRGAEVEVDKGVIDQLSESLVQIVRNAAVHGIEPVSERLKAGKPLMGTITVTARNCATNVVVTVKDDGRGISREKIVEAAKQAGVDGLREPATDAELLNLLIKPGVSTSAKPDEMSGRGVGLDVVNSAIEKLRGSLELETHPGFGCEFRIRIPQTLTVLDCVSLRSGDQAFLLPRLDIYSLVRSDPKDVITRPDSGNLLRFKGFDLPIIDLGAFYRSRDDKADFSTGVFAVLEGETSAAAVYADGLTGSLRAAISPLPELLTKLGARENAMAGCVAQNDGRIGFILDADALLRIAGGVSV